MDAWGRAALGWDELPCTVETSGVAHSQKDLSGSALVGKSGQSPGIGAFFLQEFGSVVETSSVADALPVLDRLPCGVIAFDWDLSSGCAPGRDLASTSRARCPSDQARTSRSVERPRPRQSARRRCRRLPHVFGKSCPPSGPRAGGAMPLPGSLGRSHCRHRFQKRSGTRGHKILYFHFTAS